MLAQGLTRKDPAKAEREKFEKLTERERDVLRLVAQGFSAPEIGEKLFISPKTVDTYKQRIHEKMGLSHRAEYVQLAANAVSAKKIGALAAEAARSKGISQVIFDRNGAKYHGKVKALADAAREAGLKF